MATTCCCTTCFFPMFIYLSFNINNVTFHMIFTGLFTYFPRRYSPFFYGVIQLFPTGLFTYFPRVYSPDFHGVIHLFPRDDSPISHRVLPAVFPMPAWRYSGAYITWPPGGMGLGTEQIVLVEPAACLAKKGVFLRWSHDRLCRRMATKTRCIWSCMTQRLYV